MIEIMRRKRKIFSKSGMVLQRIWSENRITTVLVTFLWINGPHRIFFVKWRFEGGRFV